MSRIIRTSILIIYSILMFQQEVNAAPPRSTKVATCKDSASNASKNNCGYAASQIAASCTPSTVGMYYKVITSIGQGGVSIDVFSCNAPNWTYR